ncbi:hypothetical protein B0H14DRAFT_2392705, partial [Mycena olivaceomarginata]
RPQHTLEVILRCALSGSAHKRLTTWEIYAAMEEKFAYYRTTNTNWKGSVRHQLLSIGSSNAIRDRQQGSYWTVNSALHREQNALASVEKTSAAIKITERRRDGP